jgi:hypothetical protein
MWEILAKVVGFLWIRLSRPLTVEVEGIQFQDVGMLSDSSIAIVSPHPKRYVARLVISNRSARTVFVESIDLVLPEITIGDQFLHGKALKLDPGEPSKYKALFAVAQNFGSMQPTKYTIIVVPTKGRAVRCGGVL